MNHTFNPVRRQKGASTIVLICIIGVFGVFVVTSLTLFPMYYDNIKLKTALEAIQHDNKVDPKSRRAIWDSLQKRLYIDGVDKIKREHVTMERADGKTTVTVTYENRDDLLGNLFIGTRFSESVVIDR